MNSLRRNPSAVEQAMWPDALPATVIVPAGFTLFVPDDLDLSETDLVVNGAVMLPLSSPGAASETVAGLVELATEAEAVSGTDTGRAVTPAGLAAAVAEIPTGQEPAFDEVEFTELGRRSGTGWCILCTFKKDGGVITTRERVTVVLGVNNQASGVEMSAVTGGASYSVYGYLSSRKFKHAGDLAGTSGTVVAGVWGWINAYGYGEDGQAVVKASQNPNPYGATSFSVIVIRSDGVEFESGTFSLPQGE